MINYNVKQFFKIWKKKPSKMCSNMWSINVPDPETMPGYFKTRQAAQISMCSLYSLDWELFIIIVAESSIVRLLY